MYIKDYVTGREMLDTPEERVRQKVEEYLIKTKKYPKESIMVDYAFLVEVDNKKFVAKIDLLIKVDDVNFFNIECAPPTVLSSLERPALACSRILKPPIPFTILTDWEQTKIFESVTGKVVGSNLNDIPSFDVVKKLVKDFKPTFLDITRIEKEKRVLFAFMNVLHCKCNILD